MKNRTANLIGALALALSDAQSAAARETARLGLSACAALVTIGQNPGMSIVSLSRVLNLTHSVAVRLVESLANDGYLERLQGRDKRHVCLHLTSEGRRRRRVILNARETCVTAAVAALSANERDQLAGIAATMLTALTTGRADADHICRLCNEAACPESECPVEQQAIRIEQARR